MFGCCLSGEDLQNYRIARAQKLAENESSKKITILILGTGDSGKTTLRKQLVNVHTDQFAKAEYRASFAHIILGNLLDGTVEVLLAYKDENKKTEEISIIKERARETSNELTPELRAMLIKVIWEDPTFMELVHQSSFTSKIQLQDCFVSFAEALKQTPNWGLAGWIPSAEDCIRSRVRTSGVQTDHVRVNNVPFVFYDVGGQRAERRKWFGSFEACTAAIFVMSLAEYDQFLFEDRNKNRLEEALELFRDCVNSPWLSKTTMILFLNKEDLFRRKFIEGKIPLNISGKFPDAPTANETAADAQVAIDWIANKFKTIQQQRLARSPSQQQQQQNGGGDDVLAKAELYVYSTTATSPDNIKKVFAVCKDVVLKQSLLAFGFN